MGNVHASGFGFSSPPVTPAPIVQEPLIAPEIEEPKNVLPDIPEMFPNNPGTMEELHKKCKEIYPMNFEGGKFMLNKPLTNHFQVSHSISFPTSQPPGYRFGATYVGTQQNAPNEAFPVLLGEIDPSGNLSANIIHQLASMPAIRTKFVAQIQQSKWQAAQGSMDYRGDNFTASVTAGNIDLFAGSGVLVAHYLQAVTSKLDLGAELAYQYSQQMPGGQVAILSCGGRYNGSNFTASGTVGASSLHACYYQKASENLQIGAELETNFRLQESSASVAYQVDIPKANFSFKGTLDSNWTMGAVLEKKLVPLPFTFALSLMHNHTKNQFKLGAGFIIG